MPAHQGIGNQAESPRYRCHKEVTAFKILQVSGDALLVESSHGVSFPYPQTPEFMEKHKPQVGGYLVFYEDGYRSFSPGKAFEEGYTRI